MSTGKGNKAKNQRARRQFKRTHQVKKRSNLYPLIDDNLSYYPYAYCKRHQGFLTVSLLNTHKCDKRMCMHCIYDIEPLMEKNDKVKGA